MTHVYHPWLHLGIMITISGSWTWDLQRVVAPKGMRLIRDCESKILMSELFGNITNEIEVKIETDYPIVVDGYTMHGVRLWFVFW